MGLFHLAELQFLSHFCCSKHIAAVLEDAKTCSMSGQ